MISKYNRYKIILICLLCNSIIAISEQQSLTDQSIVDNMLSNDPIDSSLEHKESHNQDNQDNQDNIHSVGQSIKTSKKSKVLKRKKKKLRKTALRKSLKSNKNKKVINKSKESPPLSKGAKISLGAIGFGGFGLLILASRKSSTSSKTNSRIAISTLSSERSQQSSSKSDQKPLRILSKTNQLPILDVNQSLVIVSDSKEYSSLDDLKDLNHFFNKLKEKYPIKEDDLQTINTYFPQLNIDEKIELILYYYNHYKSYRRKLSDRLYNISLRYYLISLLEQNEITQLLNQLRNTEHLSLFTRSYIFRPLKLWDIFIEYDNIKEKYEKKELFLILTYDERELTTTKKKEINQIVKDMINKTKYHDLLILLLIFDRNFYKIFDEANKVINLSNYLLSELQTVDKQQLLSEISQLSKEELKMYDIDSKDINKIKESLQ